MRFQRSCLVLAVAAHSALLGSALGVQKYSSSSFAPASTPVAAAIQETPPSANSQPVPSLLPSATPEPSLIPAGHQDPALSLPTPGSATNVLSGLVYRDSIHSQNLAAPLQNWMEDARSGAQVRFVVFGGIDQERRRSICEDSAVFHHMLTKVVPQWNRNALGVTVSSQREPYAWYIEGHGLVMFFQVPRPVAPGDSGDEKAKEEPRELTAWERAKQEMQGQRDSRYNQAIVEYAIANGQAAYAYYPGAMQVAQYDAGFASELDKVVSGALQQVGNFRDLAQDDSVTVFVYGPSTNPTAGGRSVYAWRVRLSDVRGDDTVPAEAIERRQYLETEPASQPMTAPMPNEASAR